MLSLSQLEQQGFEVTIKDGKCTIKGMFDTTSTEDLIDVDSKKEIDLGNGKVVQDDNDTHMEDRCGLDKNKEKAIRAIMKYYDDLYFADSLVGEKSDEKETPSVNEFESFIGFMSMVNDQEIREECKELVAEHFKKLVKWFYETIMSCEERPIPAKIKDQDICLLDLYLTVKNYGGHARISIKNCWIDVAKDMGLQEDFADYLKDLYASHLSLLEAYFDVAKNYSSGYYVPKAADCGGTSGVAKPEKPEEETEPEKPEEETEYEMVSSEGDEEYVGNNGIEGKIEFDDGDSLIISFEVDENSWEEKQLMKTGEDKEDTEDSDDEDYLIVID